MPMRVQTSGEWPNVPIARDRERRAGAASAGSTAEVPAPGIVGHHVDRAVAEAGGAHAWRSLWPALPDALRAGTWGDGGRDY